MPIKVASMLKEGLGGIVMVSPLNMRYLKADSSIFLFKNLYANGNVVNCYQ